MTLSKEQHDLIHRTGEVRIETSSDARSSSTIIWIVTVGDDVYVRSVRGDSGQWYQRTLANPRVAILVNGQRIEFRAEGVEDADMIEAVSAAIRDKYPPGRPVDRMVREEVLDTTLRLVADPA